MSYQPEVLPFWKSLHETAQAGKFPQRILSDFRLSFRFSGSEYNQHCLFYLLGIQYYLAGSVVQAATKSSFDAILESDWRRAVLPPREHQAVTSDHVAREGLNEWSKFKQVASPDSIGPLIADMYATQVNHYNDILSELAHNLVRNEIDHIASGRPNRPTHTKRYASFVRTYIFDQQSTGSPAFNAVFHDMREIMTHRSPDNIGRLAKAWETKNAAHFYPDEFLASATNAGTQDFFNHTSVKPYEASLSPASRGIPRTSIAIADTALLASNLLVDTYC